MVLRNSAVVEYRTSYAAFLIFRGSVHFLNLLGTPVDSLSGETSRFSGDLAMHLADAEWRVFEFRLLAAPARF